jgi:hypothetical protein
MKGTCAALPPLRAGGSASSPLPASSTIMRWSADLASGPEARFVKAMPLSDFVTPSIMQTHDLGPGDEVFMIGRFVKHDRLGGAARDPEVEVTPAMIEAGVYRLEALREADVDSAYLAREVFAGMWAALPNVYQ